MILDYDAYEDAAEEFHPHIKFFATFSPKVTYVIIIYTTLFTYRALVWPIGLDFRGKFSFYVIYNKYYLQYKWKCLLDLYLSKNDFLNV